MTDIRIGYGEVEPQLFGNHDSQALDMKERCVYFHLRNVDINNLRQIAQFNSNVGQRSSIMSVHMVECKVEW